MALLFPDFVSLNPLSCQTRAEEASKSDFCNAMWITRLTSLHFHETIVFEPTKWLFCFLVVFFLGFHPFFLLPWAVRDLDPTQPFWIRNHSNTRTPCSFHHCWRSSNEFNHNEGYSFWPPADNRSCLHAPRILQDLVRRSRYLLSCHSLSHSSKCRIPRIWSL